MVRSSTPGCYVFIVNPASGRGKMTQVIRRVRAVLRDAGHRVAIYVTGGTGAATALAAQTPRRTRAVVAVGGDGTVREVAQGLIGRSIPLCILPAGTENLVARQFDIRPDGDSLCATLMHGTTRDIDVGQVGDRVFLVVAGVGFDAEVVDRLSRSRRGHITHMDYFFPTWRTFWEHRFPQLSITADGSKVFRGRGLALVGNMPRYGIHLDILRRAQFDDGLLDLCVFPCGNPAKLLVHAFRTLCGRHLARGDAIYLQAGDIAISSPGAVPIELDGDVAGRLPARLRVLPNALRLLLGSPHLSPRDPGPSSSE